MSNRLSEIIREYYVGLRNPELLKLFKKVSHIAGLILADIYDIYESSHEKELLTEIKFFLDLKNPIKHIVNILNNSGNNGTMSVDDAILEEYKIIKSITKDDYEEISLLEIIESVYLNLKDKRELYQSTNKDITTMIVDKLNEYRINNKLDSDTRVIASQYDLFKIILNVVERKNNGEDLKELLKELYFTILRRDGSDTNRMENYIKTVIQDTFVKVFEKMENDKLMIHKHLEHVAESTHNCLTEMCEINNNILSEVLSKKPNQHSLKINGDSSTNSEQRHGRRGGDGRSSMF